jgi:parallel beta-helix repeat protein
VIGGTVTLSGNIISGNQLSGILIDSGAAGNQVQGNSIGTDTSGTHALGNLQRGIYVTGASKNLIGGTVAGAGNVISANAWAGVLIDSGATDNQLQGNLIGTDVTGTQMLGNGSFGVRIAGASMNTIGGTAAGARNIISGNAFTGIRIDSGATGNQVQGNAIGTDAGGTLNLGNHNDGIHIVGAANNAIGGTAAGAGNTIAFNGAAGVSVDGATATGNSILGDLLFANGLGGIVLSNGGNSMAPAPTLTMVTPGSSTAIQGTLSGTPSTTYTLNFYANLGKDPSGHAEGQIYLGSATVTTDASGNSNFSITLTVATSAGQFITATATDPLGDTSGLSTAFAL